MSPRRSRLCCIFPIKASIFCFSLNAVSPASAGWPCQPHARLQTGVNPTRALSNYSACVNKPSLSEAAFSKCFTMGSGSINHSKSLNHQAPTSTVHWEATSCQLRSEKGPERSHVPAGHPELRFLSRPAGRFATLCSSGFSLVCCLSI